MIYNLARIKKSSFGCLITLLLLSLCSPLYAKEKNSLYTGMDYVSLEYGELPSEEDALLTIGGNINLTSITNVVFEAGFGNRNNESGVRMRGSMLLQVLPIKRFGVAPYLIGGLSQMELGTQQCQQDGSCTAVGVKTTGLNYGLGLSIDAWHDRVLNVSWSRFSGSDDVRLNMFSLGVAFR